LGRRHRAIWLDLTWRVLCLMSESLGGTVARWHDRAHQTGVCRLTLALTGKIRAMWLLVRRICSRENMIALLLCLLAIALIVVTTDSAPQWIYQGF